MVLCKSSTRNINSKIVLAYVVAYVLVCDLHLCNIYVESPNCLVDERDLRNKVRLTLMLKPTTCCHRKIT